MKETCFSSVFFALHNSWPFLNEQWSVNSISRRKTEQQYKTPTHHHLATTDIIFAYNKLVYGNELDFEMMVGRGEVVERREEDPRVKALKFNINQMIFISFEIMYVLPPRVIEHYV